MTQSKWTALLGLSVAAMLGGAMAAPAAVIRWREPAEARAGAAGANSPAPAVQPPDTATALVHLVADARHYRDGSYTGPSVSAYYGLVQVQAIVQGGNLVAVRVLRYPSDRSTSRRIAARSLPVLEREVIRAQSGRVHAVSGATLTSRAYMRSIDAALRQAAG